MRVKDIKEGASDLKEALEKEEEVYLFGDGDLDGVASVLVAEKALEEMGKEVTSSFFSDRGSWGYGLSSHYLKLLEKKKPGLLIMFDCGTGNRKEIEKAKKMGFKVVVIDHHKPVETLPPAFLIVNPKARKESEFQNLCATALTVKVARSFLKGVSKEKDLLFSVLALLATITDQMTRDEINEEIIEQGIEDFYKTKNPALRALLKQAPVQKIEAYQVERYITPLLSSASSRTIYRFLKERSFRKAQKVVGLLKEKRELQKERVEEIIREAKDRFGEDELIFLGDKDWPLFLAARAASKLVNEFKKPVFLYQKGPECQGSARAPSGFNLLKMMEPCSSFLINWGGHKQAAGFGLLDKDIKKFRNCLKNSI